MGVNFSGPPPSSVIQTNQQNYSQSTLVPETWSIAGGKGGVGKSLVSANLCLALSLMGYKVLAVDLDLGGANLHTCLGVNIPEKTLSDYFDRPSFQMLKDIIVSTLMPNLKLISGAQDHFNISQLTKEKRALFFKDLKKIPVDFIILDLGAGTHESTLDFYLKADIGILVSLPEPTSIENTYRFIKTSFQYYLTTNNDLKDLIPFIEGHLNSKMKDSQGSKNLWHALESKGMKKSYLVKSLMDHFSPKLILNQIRTSSDIDIGQSMSVICKKYFGIGLEFIGFLPFDSYVWQSIRKRRPLLLEYPNSDLVQKFELIIKKLIAKRNDIQKEKAI